MPKEPPRRGPSGKKPHIRLVERERPVGDLVKVRERLEKTQVWYDSLVARVPREIGHGYDTTEVVNWAGELDNFLSTCPQIFLRHRATELIEKVRYILTYLNKDTMLRESLELHLTDLQKLAAKRDCPE